jgi:hypothetical protein
MFHKHFLSYCGYVPSSAVTNLPLSYEVHLHRRSSLRLYVRNCGYWNNTLLVCYSVPCVIIANLSARNNIVLIVGLNLVEPWYNRHVYHNSCIIISSFSADEVYLEDERKRKEYVLADTGLIWRGSTNSKQETVWKYAQFEKDILDCCLYLIKRISYISNEDCWDPVKISRAITAAVSQIEILYLLLWFGRRH